MDGAKQIYFFDHFFARTSETPPRPPPVPFLPSFIAQIPRGVPRDCSIPHDPSWIYAVSFSSICYPTGRLRYSDGDALRLGLRLEPSARLCLIGTGSDKLLEAFAEKSEDLSSWHTIAKMRFEFATGLTFSAWEQSPRFDQLFNQDRNRASVDTLSSLGIPAIPFIFATPEDLPTWRDWLAERPSITTIALLAQFYRSPEKFRQFLSELKRLRISLRRPYHFLIVGCATAEKIRGVFRALPAATIITCNPILKGMRGQGVKPGLRFAPMPLLSRSHLIRGNLLEYEASCEEQSLAA